MQYRLRFLPRHPLGRVALIVASLESAWVTAQTAVPPDTSSAPADDARRVRFTATGAIDPEGGDSGQSGRLSAAIAAPEAPAAFDNLTNGFDDQATFDQNRGAF